MNLRHGDWLFTPVKTTEGKAIKHKGNTFCFGKGEVTFHEHNVKVKDHQDMEWFKDEFGNYYVNMKTDGVAIHPEHSEKNDLVIPAGIYKVSQAREYDWMQHVERKVID